MLLVVCQVRLRAKRSELMFSSTPRQILSDIDTGIKHDIQKLQALYRAERKCMYFCMHRQAMSPGSGR